MELSELNNSRRVSKSKSSSQTPLEASLDAVAPIEAEAVTSNEAGSDEEGSDVQDILEVAESYFEAGHLEKAEQVLQQLLLQKTTEPKVFYLLGSIYYDRGKHQRAEIAFRRALDIEPEYRDAAIGLTILYNELGQYEKAEQLFQKTRETVEQQERGKDQHILSEFSVKHESLGDLYREHEYFKEAHDEFEKALKFRENDLGLIIKSAKALEKSGAGKAAIEKLKELKTAFPEDITCRLTLGMFYFNAHRIPEAVSEWEAVLKRDSNNKEAALYLKVAAQTQMTSL